MVYFLVIVQMLLLMICKVSRQPKIINNLFFLFGMWWISISILSKYIPYGGYDVSDDTYMLLTIFLFCFGIFYVFSRNVRYTSEYEDSKLIFQYEIYLEKNKKVLACLFVCTVVLSFYAYKYSTIMSIDTFLNARNERFYVGNLFNSNLELLFYNYFITMWKYFFAFVIAFSIVYSRVKSKLFVLSLINLILYTYIGSSRFPIVLLVINLVVIYVVRGTYSKLQIDRNLMKRIFLVVFVMFFSVFLMSYITAFRRGMLSFSWNSIFDNFSILYDQIIAYNIGPISGLSYLNNNGILENHWFFGRGVLLNGVEELFSYLCSFVGIPFQCVKYTLAEISNKNIMLGRESFNALYTCVFWFFSDFGYIGIVLYSAIFGWIEKKSISFFAKQPSIGSLLLLVHMSYFMLVSNMIWQVNNVDSLLYLIFICIIYNKIRREGMLCLKK